jgi:DNA-binding response OmpR family regulator
MGLAVTHGLVKRHGGTINVQSKVGKGATFTIRLPLAQEPIGKTEEPATRTADRELTILVIEDDERIATLLEMIFVDAGHSVFKALSGGEGLAIFNKEPVDLVICDLGMPGMNGWDVGKAIRSVCQEKGITKPPFVLLTGWGGQELEREKIAESGTDAVVAKPIDPAALLATVQEIATSFKSRSHDNLGANSCVICKQEDEEIKE